MSLPIPLLILLLVLQKSTCPAPGPTAWELEDLRGRVKSVSIQEIHYSYTKPELELKKRILFDAKGNYVEVEEPDMLPRISKSPPPPVYVFNSACKPIERRETEIRDGIVRTTFRYDEWGREIELASLDKQGGVVYREVSVYNGSGKLTEKVDTIRVHPEHFRPMRYDVYRNTRTVFSYDQHGNETEEMSFDFRGNYFGKWVKRYDDQNRIVSITRYDSRGRTTEQTVSEYDAQGRLEARTDYQSFTYDRNNNLIAGTITTDVGTFQLGTRYVFTYDARGNWIQQRGFEIKEATGQRSLTLDSVTYRKISYFD